MTSEPNYWGPPTCGRCLGGPDFWQHRNPGDFRNKRGEPVDLERDARELLHTFVVRASAPIVGVDE